jgi:uncharacterized protein (DUF362 family)
MIDVILETGTERRKVVLKAVEALGDVFIEKAKAAETILIKVNLVHHEIQLASTHVDAVRAVLDVIRVHSRSKVYIGDASYHGTKAAFRHFGYEGLLSEFENVELVDLNDDDSVEGYTVKTDGSHAPMKRSKLAVEADFKISLTPMKLHRDVAVSLSVENWTFGTWIVPPRIGAMGRVWAKWPWLQEEGPWAHHKTLAALYEQVPCDVAIVDGILAMQGDGPVHGEAIRMGLVLVGTDAVAVDAVGTTLMGIDPQDVGYLFMCNEQKSGIIDMSKINVPPILVANLTRPFGKPLSFDQKLGAWREVGSEA